MISAKEAHEMAKANRVARVENDLISRQALLQWIDEFGPANKSAVLNAPTIDAVPVVHGKNTSCENPADEFICSECGFILDNYFSVEIDEHDGDKSYHEYIIKFCPECGAKMDKEANDE